MDKDKMLEIFKQHIRNKSTDKLIEDLQKYNIETFRDTPESVGTVEIRED